MTCPWYVPFKYGVHACKSTAATPGRVSALWQVNTIQKSQHKSRMTLQRRCVCVFPYHLFHLHLLMAAHFGRDWICICVVAFALYWPAWAAVLMVAHATSGCLVFSTSNGIDLPLNLYVRLSDTKQETEDYVIMAIFCLMNKSISYDILQCKLRNIYLDKTLCFGFFLCLGAESCFNTTCMSAVLLRLPGSKKTQYERLRSFLKDVYLA